MITELAVKYWVEWLFGIVAAALGIGYKHLSKQIKARKAEDTAIKNGLLAILHDRLYQSCTYCLNKGCVGTDELKNIEYMYTSYHTLGGNGTGTVLYDKVKALQIKDN